MLQLFTVYIIDTNIVIDIARRIYPRQHREEARAVVERLIQDGSVISHREVYLELQDGAKHGDAAFAWAKSNAPIFREVTEQHERDVLSVLAEHPSLADPTKTGPDADPWLVAVAMDTGGVIVTGDGAIKAVCDELQIRCIDVYEFLTENGWPTAATSDS